MLFIITLYVIRFKNNGKAIKHITSYH